MFARSIIAGDTGSGIVTSGCFSTTVSGVDVGCTSGVGVTAVVVGCGWTGVGMVGCWYTPGCGVAVAGGIIGCDNGCSTDWFMVGYGLTTSLMSSSGVVG